MISTTVHRAPKSHSFRGLFQDLKEPLFRNGHALVLSSMLTSGLGLIFWIFAARNYTSDIVGRDTTALSVLTFVGGVSQLNLATVLIRFIPTAGRKRRHLVLMSYAVGAAISIALAIGFLAWLPHFVPALAFIASSWTFRTWWIVSTVAWAIFVLEDGALTGLRRTHWVPIENAGFSIIKAALVIPLAVIYPSTGIFLAWTVAALVTVVPTNLCLFGRAIPKEQSRAPTGEVPFDQLVSYVPFDCLAAFAWLAATSLLPLLIIHRIGSTASAIYSLAWLITYVMYLVSINLGASLIVESASSPAEREIHTRRVMAHLAKLLVPAAVLVAIGAPQIMRLFGSTYAARGATTLRLLALSAIPFIITSSAVSTLRALRRTRSVLLIDGILCSSVVIMTWLFLPRLGVVGAGLAWLIGQSLVAISLMLTARKWLSSDRPLIGGSAGLRITLAGFGALSPSMIQWASSVRTRSNERRSLRFCRRVIPELIAGVTWRGQPMLELVQGYQIRPSASDLTVAILEDGGRSPIAAVKIARSEQARIDLLNGLDVLGALLSDDRLGSWRELIPIYTLHNLHEITFAVEPAIRGLNADRLIETEPWRKSDVVRLAVRSISRLHTATAHNLRVDEPNFSMLFDESLSVLRSAHPDGHVPDRQLRAADYLEKRLRTAFIGKVVRLSRVHGDFSPGNIVVSPDVRRITGILDWGQGRSQGIPAIDVLTLISMIHCRTAHQQLGNYVSDIVYGAPLPDQVLLTPAADVLAATNFNYQELILVCWLEHVTGNIVKSSRYLTNRIWWACNMEPVFEAVLR